jgi:hypothetical protein
MSNEKFTPGPWAIQQLHRILWVGTPKRNGQLDELILHINQDVSYKDEKKERNLANAKLIAAAPAMYDTLKAIAAWAGNLPDESLTSKTGANDAAYRGEMVVAMRKFANVMLNKIF